MYSSRTTTPSTGSCSEQVERLRDALAAADAIVIGAGAGMSEAAGLTYGGARFERHFGDFRRRYGITDMYAGGFYPFGTPEEYWAWWSRQIYVNRYDVSPGKPYRDLLALVEDRDYFVLTTSSSWRALRSSGSFTHRATMGCGSAPGPATRRPTTMNRLSAAWLHSSWICGSHRNCFRGVRSAARR